jgi:DNA-binding IclR family transcriptional regulator
MGFHSAKLVSAPTGGESGSSTLRAFALLERIVTADVPPTLEDLTRATGLPKPSVYRMLRVLMREGLIEREVHRKRYLVGGRMCALSLAVQMRSPQRRERAAILSRLVDAIGETCNFTMLDGNEVLYLERVETPANIRLHVRPGSRVPLHCTASGKLLLSELPAAQVLRLLGPGPLARHTERTIVDVGVLLRELVKVRASSVGTDSGEYLAGSVCLAVPVRDTRRRMCAAVAVHGPAPRMSLRKGYGYLAHMRAAAAEIAATFESPADGRAEEPRRAPLNRTGSIAA